jgi:hypothetical protein
MAVAFATNNSELAMHHIDKVQSLLDEIKREVFWASRRSGEVK